MGMLTLKKEFIRTWFKDVKPTDLERHVLDLIFNSIRIVYQRHARFNEYIRSHQDEVVAFLKNLDEGSREEVMRILDDLDFMKEHTAIESVEEFVNRGDKAVTLMKEIISYKNEYPIPDPDFYDYCEAVFKYKHGLIEVPQEVQDFLEGRDFVVCGAYNGETSLMLSKFYNPKTVYSIEPDRANYEILLKTIEFYGSEKIIPINKGVGASKGMMRFTSRGAGSCISKEDGEEVIELTTVDDLVHEHNLSVGAIQMDVEGFELEALKGAQETIWEHKPVLLLAIYHDPEQFFGTIPLIQGIRSDYIFRIKHLCDVRPLGETHLIAW